MNLKVDAPYRAKSSVIFGTPLPDEEERLFAFVLVEGRRPRTFDFPVDDGGMQELADIARSERVLQVVQGRQVELEMRSTVAVSLGRSRLEHSLIIGQEA